MYSDDNISGHAVIGKLHSGYIKSSSRWATSDY